MSKTDARLMEPGVSGSALIVLWVSSAEGPRVWIVAVFPLMPVEAIRESGAPMPVIGDPRTLLLGAPISDQAGGRWLKGLAERCLSVPDENAGVC